MSEMQQRTTTQEETMTQRSFWAAVIMSGNGLVFLGLILYLVFRAPAWQLFLLSAVTLIASAIGFISIWQIRRGRVALGVWLLFGYAIPPLVAALFIGATGLPAAAFIIMFSSLIVVFVIPSESRRGPIVCSAIAVAIALAFEWLNPAFRQSVPELVSIAPIATGIMTMAFLVVMIRQAWLTQIQVKLLVVMFSVVIIIVFLQTGINMRVSRELNEEAEHQRITSLYEDFNDNINTLTTASAALSVSYADREDIKQFYLAQDREGLLELLAPIFETLTTEYNIRHLYVENPDGTVYVRIHNPPKFGDDVTYRLTAASALESQDTVAGVDIGPSRIGVRSVSPLWDQDEFIGMLEVGLDYDQAFIDSFKARNNAEYNLWITYAAAEAPGLAPPDNAPTAPTDQVFFYAGTHPLVLPIEQEVYDQVLVTGEPATKFVSLEDQDWAVIVAPMLGYGNRVIGIVEILTSRTDALIAINQSRLAVLIPAGFLTLVGLAAMWLIINQIVLRPVGHLASVAEQQIEGVLSARVEMFPPDEFGDLGRTFNNLSEQLEISLRTQDQTIADRTRALETSTEVSRRLSTILDQDELVQEVVYQVQSAFDYYHAHIYLYDQAGESLEMVGGTGEPGQQMLAGGHKILKGKGLVGRAAETNEVILTPDVSQAIGWQPNPLLPDTKAEIAFPIADGGEVLGVLDVQQDEIGDLDQVDADLLLGIAGQVGIALQNTQAFQETQQQAAQETQVADISRQIQETTNVEDALKVAVRELGRALGTETSVKLLATDEEETNLQSTLASS